MERKLQASRTAFWLQWHYRSLTLVSHSMWAMQGEWQKCWMFNPTFIAAFSSWWSSFANNDEYFFSWIKNTEDMCRATWVQRVTQQLGGLLLPVVVFMLKSECASVCSRHWWAAGLPSGRSASKRFEVSVQRLHLQSSPDACHCRSFAPQRGNSRRHQAHNYRLQFQVPPNPPMLTHTVRPTQWGGDVMGCASRR